MGRGTEIVFVEGGSTDSTWDTIQRTIRSSAVLSSSRRSSRRGGKGDAVRVGFDSATGAMLMILDADLTMPPEELPKFFDAMVSGITDYVQGTRVIYPMEDEAMRFLNKVGNAFFARTFSFLLDQPIKDTLCAQGALEDGLRAPRQGPRVFRRSGSFGISTSSSGLASST